MQGWGAGAGCFRLLGAGAGALEKKPGAGAANKLAGSLALFEDKKHKEIVLKLLFISRSRSKKNRSWSRSRLGKKSGAGAA